MPTASKATKKEAKVTKSTTARQTKSKTTSHEVAQIKDLLEAGVHFGHQTRRWNPRMRPFIFTAKNGVHIIDLTQTAEYLERAAQFVKKVAADGGQIMYVGTKRQAREIIKSAAESVAMPYVTHRWLGGMLTNWQTIEARIKYLKRLENKREEGELGRYTKKEASQVEREIEHLNTMLGGVKDMRRLPAALFVVDIVREHIAILEARKLAIPTVAIVDSNADPDLVDWPIPGNDDAIRSITVITNTITNAIKEGQAAYDAKTPPVEENAE